MPQRVRKLPSYCLHRPSGQAVVYIDRRPIYLGPYNSPESHEAYERAIAQWRLAQAEASRATGERTVGDAPDAPRPAQLAVNELLIRYFEFASEYYVDADGQRTHEYANLLYAARPLRRLFGDLCVAEFGPRALKQLRTLLVEEGKLCRRTINRRVNLVKRIFKWAVSEELAPGGAYEALRSIEPLRAGRTPAKEKPPVRPVPWEHVAPVLEVVSPQLRAMIEVQYLGGMRPQDIVTMKRSEIERDGDVWVYRPATHKTKWRGHSRQIHLGPRAQALLLPFLERADDDYLFSPAEAESWRNQQRRQQRKTPLTPSQRARHPKSRPQRAKRSHYDRHSYARAIQYAIAKVNRERAKREDEPVPSWSPNRLRHTRATDIRREFGLEGAQCILGQKHARVTEVYAERDAAVARRIQEKLG